jgi:hypothetical protein
MSSLRSWQINFRNFDSSFARLVRRRSIRNLMFLALVAFALDLHPARRPIAHAQIDVEVDQEMNEESVRATPPPKRRRIRGLRDEDGGWVRPSPSQTEATQQKSSASRRVQTKRSQTASRKKATPPSVKRPRASEVAPVEAVVEETNRNAEPVASTENSEADQEAVLLEESQDRREVLVERADLNAAQPDDLPGSVSVEAEFSVRRVGVLFRGRSVAQGQSLATEMAKQLSAKTYLLAKTVEVADFPRLDAADGSPVQRGNFKTWSSQYRVDAFLLLQEVDLSLRWTLFSSRGHVLLSGTLGLQEKLSGVAESQIQKLSEPMVDRLVALFPYRGFVTRVEAGRVRLNLGERHGVRVGDRLQLLTYSGRRFDSPLKRLGVVEVERLMGNSQSEAIVAGRYEVPVYAKVGFQAPTQVNLAAQTLGTGTDWALTVGGELVGFAGDAAEARFQPKVFRFNATPFGVLGLAYRDSLVRGHFGSVRSDTETLNLFEVWALHNWKTWGGDSSALLVSFGLRYLSLQVVPRVGAITSLESGNVISPMLELRYNSVSRGLIRLFVLGEAFYPLISSGGSGSGLSFAFGGGAGAGAQLSLTPRLAIEVSGRSRYFRRPVEGLSGVQERQNTVGGTLIFRF